VCILYVRCDYGICMYTFSLCTFSDDDHVCMYSDYITGFSGAVSVSVFVRIHYLCLCLYLYICAVSKSVYVCSRTVNLYACTVVVCVRICFVSLT